MDTNIPIIYFQDNLFLNCPKCKETAYLDFNTKDPSKINISCFKCNNKNEEYLEDYMTQLTKLSSPTEVKCEKHNNFLDKYCYKCHKQFCSECDMKNHIECSPIKTIQKIITKEKVEDIKKNIDECKEYFKNYINSYMSQFFINKPQDSKEIILQSLVIPYTQKMIYFFYFCECALLNYNIEFPDFYQQMNLKTILSIFNTKIELMTLNSINAEYIFNYEDNNYVSKHRVKLKFKENENIANLPNNENFFCINKETIVIRNFDGVKIYKNGNCIHTISRKYEKVNFYKINEENFAVIQKSTIDACISIFSLKYNEVISTKNYIVFRYIFNIDTDTFGVASSDYITIFKIEDKEVKRISGKNMDRPSYEYMHSIRIPGTEYIATLLRKEIVLKNKNDFSFVKSINIEEMDIFNHFYIDNSGRIFLGGYKIGLFDIINWKVIIIRNDNIKRFQGYLAGIQSEIEYSDIVLTYFNRIICKRQLKQTQGSTYDDIPNSVTRDDNEICVFDFDPENNITKIIEIKKDIYPNSVILNDKNEIIISSNKGVQIYIID